MATTAQVTYPVFQGVCDANCNTGDTSKVFHELYALQQEAKDIPARYYGYITQCVHCHLGAAVSYAEEQRPSPEAYHETMRHTRRHCQPRSYRTSYLGSIVLAIQTGSWLAGYTWESTRRTQLVTKGQ